MKKRLLFALTFLSMALAAASPVAARGPVTTQDGARNYSDNLPGPQAQQQYQLRQTAMQMVLNGQATPVGAQKVIKIHHGKGGNYVQLAFQGKDQILTLLGDFGDQQATHDHGTLGVINHGGAPGPTPGRPAASGPGRARGPPRPDAQLRTGSPNWVRWPTTGTVP